MAMQDRTLYFLVHESSVGEVRVLLGLKKVGFGAGKYTGFGGKIEVGEPVTIAAVRELEEETGVRVLEENLQAVGHLTFLFPARPGWNQVVHVFLATTWEGEPVESVEMSPAWFPLNKIPLDRMWQDAVHWLSRILMGERVRASFTFKDDNETIDELEVKAYV